LNHYVLNIISIGRRELPIEPHEKSNNNPRQMSKSLQKEKKRSIQNCDEIIEILRNNSFSRFQQKSSNDKENTKQLFNFLLLAFTYANGTVKSRVNMERVLELEKYYNNKMITIAYNFITDENDQEQRIKVLQELTPLFAPNEGE
jgi:hypothetical protein